jgi:photosystem II stability/assembly factor-like uncharacterized protein
MLRFFYVHAAEDFGVVEDYFTLYLQLDILYLHRTGEFYETKLTNQPMNKHESESLDRNISIKKYLAAIKKRDRIKSVSYLEIVIQLPVPKVKKGGVALISKDTSTPKIKKVSTPLLTFSSLHESFLVTTKKEALDAILYVSADTEGLKFLQHDSITLFQFNQTTKSYSMVRNAFFFEKEKLYGFRIRSAGIYTILGLPKHPALLKTLELFSAFESRFQILPPLSRLELRNRICQMILCAPTDFSKLLFPSTVGETSSFSKGSCDLCLSLPEHILPSLPENLIPPTSSCATSEWVNKGNYNVSGCIRQLQLLRNQLFAMSANGGLWRMNVAEPLSEWLPLTDFLPRISLKAFCVHPSDLGTIYVLNDFGVLYKSSDAGSTWNDLYTFPFGSDFQRARSEARINVMTTKPNCLFLAASVSGNRTASGFFMSTDGGVSWNKTLNGQVTDIAVDPDNEQIIYLGVAEKGVFKSHDGGLTWSQQLDLNTYPTDFFDFGHIRIALGSLSPNGNLQTATNRSVAALVGMHLIRSSDARISWDNPNELTPLTLNEDGDWVRGGHQKNWCYALAVDPFNSDHILAAHVNARSSSDGGMSWSPSIRPGHEDFQSIVFDPLNRNVVYVANDGGVCKSRNGLATEEIERLDRGLYTAEFYRVGVRGQRAVGNMYHSGLQGTFQLDNPKSFWERANKGRHGINNNLEFSQVYACPKVPNRFYVVHIPTSGTVKRLLRLRFPGTGNRGQRTFEDLLHFGPTSAALAPFTGNTADVISKLNTPPAILAVDTRPESGVMLICANQAGELNGSSGGRLMKTREVLNEVSWTGSMDDYLKEEKIHQVQHLPQWKEEINHPQGFVCVQLSPLLNGRAYTISSNGELFQCEEVNENNAVWNRTGQWLCSNSVRQLAINCTDDRIVYALTESEIGLTYDGGNTWQTINTSVLPITLFNTLIASPYDPHTLFLGTDNGVFVSYNDGNNWNNFGERLPNVEVTQLFMENGTLYAVTHGRGLWSKDICGFSRRG